MDMESQKILFALSTPMEIRNECCLPSHSSPKMYLGTCFFDLSSSWGIDDRDDLLRTIHRMIDNGHAARLAGFYHRWFRYSPCEWRDYLAELNEQGQAYAQFVASTAECCGEGLSLIHILAAYESAVRQHGRTSLLRSCLVRYLSLTPFAGYQRTNGRLWR